jgi:hypothetical protein
MNCLHCNKPVILIPSAAERAKKFGGKPSDYTNLFRSHTDCAIKYRDSGDSYLIPKK